MSEANDAPERIVLVRPAGGLGDVVMTLPVARHFAEAGHQVDYAVLAGYAHWAEKTGFVNEIYSLPKKDRPARLGASEKAVRQYLHEFGIETDGARIINLWCPAWRHEAASGGIPWLNRIEAFWTGAGLKLADLPAAPLAGILPVPTSALPLDLEPKGYILIQAHSADPARNVPPELYRRQLEEHDLKTVVVGRSQWRKYIDAIEADVTLIDVADDAVAALICNAKLVLCPDSAFVHLAAVWGIPTVVFCSVTRGRLLCRRYPKAEAVQGKGCGPCYHQGVRGWNERACRRSGKVCKAFQPLLDAL